MPSPFISVICFREKGMIHFFYRSHAKKPESGLFSDWIGNNTDDLRCSDWPKCRHLLVVDFSPHFCLRINEQWIHTRVRYQISASSVFLNLRCIWRISKNRNFIHWNIFHFIVYLKVAVKNSLIIWMQFDTGYEFACMQTSPIRRRLHAGKLRVTEATNGVIFQIIN